MVAFADTKITNPLGGDCAHAPGYGLLRSIPTSKLLDSKGRLWPRKLKEDLNSYESVVYGYITCDGVNHMRVIFANNNHAFYFVEGDAIVVLQREEQ
jgi:hypothetical protein